MDLNALRDAILQGLQTAPPSSAIPELSRSMTSAFRLPGTDQAATGLGVQAGNIAEDEERKAAAARAARESEIKAEISKEQDRVDPSKFYGQKRDDGGFDFFAPDGKKITALDYAKVTGKRLDDVLSDSENPLDIQFVEDYQQMRKIMSAYANGDEEVLGELKNNDPELYKNIQNAGTPDELMRRFMDYYPDYFQREGGPPAKLQDKFSPRLSPSTQQDEQGNPTVFKDLTTPSFGKPGVYDQPTQTKNPNDWENILYNIMQGIRHPTKITRAIRR